MNLTLRQQTGKNAEEQACHFLMAKGFRLLEKNYRCYYGEIDLIMKDKDDIVFVEVRSRNRTDFGHAVETIDRGKQRKLKKTAVHYLQGKKWLHKIASRFDIITVQLTDGETQLDWIKNAFWRG